MRIQVGGQIVSIVLATITSGCGTLDSPREATSPSAAVAAQQPGLAGAHANRELNAWFIAGRKAVSTASKLVQSERPARNVILFVGDGMGVSTITAARILEGQRRGELGEENRLSFEDLPFVALSKTYSTDTQVADSAATMTAMVTGVKTRSGLLGLDETVVPGSPENVPGSWLPTILEEAELRGLATGVVSTATLTHATPAGCYAHTPSRAWQDDSRLPAAARDAGLSDIARQLIEFPYGDGLEVALGGGRSHFRPSGSVDPEDPEATGNRLDGIDLTAAWEQRRRGAEYVWNLKQLQELELDSVDSLLGLFEPKHMKFETDRERDEAGEPSLAEMTATAISILQRDEDGFFLMVEAGRIDHGHHINNADRALTDTIALSDAVRVALDQTRSDETLIIVTADHSHTLTISGYPKRGNPILGLVRSEDPRSGGQESLARDVHGLPYTTLSYANGPGYAGASKSQPQGLHATGTRPCESMSPERCREQARRLGRPDLSKVDTEDSSYLQEVTVPLDSETHAGEDVPIYAGGARAALFHGVREQSYIYHAMVEAFGWTRAGRPVGERAGKH